MGGLILQTISSTNHRNGMTMMEMVLEIIGESILGTPPD